MRRALLTLAAGVATVAGLVAAPRADAAGLTDVTAPTISGTARVGETLTASPGTWTPTPTAYAYHWLRNGQPVPNATDPTYVVGPNDDGTALSVEVDASDSVGDTGSATSAPTSTVAPGDLAATGGQSVVGVARYTHTLRARTGRFSPTPTSFAFQWLRDGTAIRGADSPTYAIRPEDVGARLSVAITGNRSGYDGSRVDTRPTAPVRYRVDVRRTVRYSVATRGRITTSLQQFAALAQQTYDDARGWRSAGIAFHRVAHGGAFTLYLAAASTLPSFSSECSTMWSCRVGRDVIINQDRWDHASPAWNAAHLGLRDYRNLVVNHETGHFLGLRDIYTCPTPGKPAPVMMEQSKGIGSCHFNPWPLPREIASRTPRAGSGRTAVSERGMATRRGGGYARVESE